MAKLVILLLVAAFFLAGAGTSSGDPAYYGLEIATADGPLSGTDALIALEFRDSTITLGVTRLVDGYGPVLDKGSVDAFNFADSEHIQPCRLGIRLVDSSPDSKWECKSVKVVNFDLRKDGEKEFPVNQWVLPGKGVHIDLCDYSVAK